MTSCLPTLWHTDPWSQWPAATLGWHVGRSQAGMMCHGEGPWLLAASQSGCPFHVVGAGSGLPPRSTISQPCLQSLGVRAPGMWLLTPTLWGTCPCLHPSSQVLPFPGWL